MAEIRGFRADTGAPALDRAAEPDAFEVTYGVRRDIDAGADLADRRGLLVDGDAQPAREQGIGREQAADASADYRDAGTGSHAPYCAAGILGFTWARYLIVCRVAVTTTPPGMVWVRFTVTPCSVDFQYSSTDCPVTRV